MLGCKGLRPVALPITLRICNVKILSKYLLSGSVEDHDGDDGKNRDRTGRTCACCNCCPCNCHPASLYDCRKYGHCLPGDNIRPNFPTLPNIPAGVFRCTSEECLGPQGQAGKCCMYRNPEYFSFHHMSYYDMHLVLRCCRNPSADTRRKPP